MEARSESSHSGKWMALLAAFFGWMFDGFEMGLFPLVANPAVEEMLGPAGKGMVMPWITGITAAFLVGAALGGLAFGWLGDRIGRVRAMVWSVLTYSIFSGLCGFSQAPWQFGLLRFMAALGMGGEWALGVALVMEVWPSTSRPTLAGIIGAAANVGFVLTGLMGLGLSMVTEELGRIMRYVLPDGTVTMLLQNRGWRLLVFLSALPALLTFFIRVFVPESSRWKHAAERAPKNRVVDIFRPGIGRLTILGTLLAAVVLLGTWGSVQQIAPWADSLSKKDPQARPLCVIWSGAGAVVGTLLAAWLAQWTSRRWAYFVLAAGSLASCQYLFRATIGYDDTFLMWTFVVGGVTAGFYGWLPLYLPELFPTRVRATAQGFAYNFGRIIAAVGTVTSGALVNRFFEGDFAKMCAVTSLVYVVGLVLIWFCPETKNRPLPE
jgi:SHS family sialic acid transporter-like MFS transporter